MSHRRVLPIFAVLMALVAVACGGGANTPAPEQPTAQVAAPAAQPTPVPTVVASPTAPPESVDGVAENGDGDAKPTGSAEPGVTPTPAIAPSSKRAALLTDKPHRRMTFGWETDFSKHSVPYTEILSGGPGRDGIPPIDKPKFADVADPPEYMKGDEPVVSLEINGEARAYPLAILIWHEIVNDEVGGVPVTVTYCPLCNTAIVFDRRLHGRVLDFGTTGNLRMSDLIMWDRQTQSWWQQITGEAIVGELTGSRLTFIPAPLVSWDEFRQAYPDGEVLSRDTGYFRRYDGPPYLGYDDLFGRPYLLYTGDFDARVLPMERVVGLSVGDQDVAYPFLLLQRHPVINDTVNGKELVIFHTSDTLSVFSGPLTPDLRRGPNRVVGSAAVYEPFVDGRKLIFKAQDGAIVDEQTGSRWNIAGHAVSGPLEGSRLTPVVHGTHFWFAWFAFNPDTIVRTAEDFADQGS